MWMAKQGDANRGVDDEAHTQTHTQKTHTPIHMHTHTDMPSSSTSPSQSQAECTQQRYMCCSLRPSHRREEEESENKSCSMFRVLISLSLSLSPSFSTVRPQPQPHIHSAPFVQKAAVEKTARLLPSFPVSVLRLIGRHAWPHCCTHHPRRELCCTHCDSERKRRTAVEGRKRERERGRRHCDARRANWGPTVCVHSAHTSRGATQGYGTA